MTKVSIFGDGFLKNHDVMMSSVVANGHIGMPHVMHHHPYDLEDNFLQILGKNLFIFSVQAFVPFVIGNLINIGHPLLFRLSNSKKKKCILVDCRKASVILAFSISKTHENKFTAFLFIIDMFWFQFSVYFFPIYSFLRCLFFGFFAFSSSSLKKAMRVFGFNFMIRGLTCATNIHK